MIHARIWDCSASTLHPMICLKECKCQLNLHTFTHLAVPCCSRHVTATTKLKILFSPHPVSGAVAANEGVVWCGVVWWWRRYCSSVSVFCSQGTCVCNWICWICFAYAVLRAVVMKDDKSSLMCERRCQEERWWRWQLFSEQRSINYSIWTQTRRYVNPHPRWFIFIRKYFWTFQYKMFLNIL